MYIICMGMYLYYIFISSLFFYYRNATTGYCLSNSAWDSECVFLMGFSTILWEIWESLWGKKKYNRFDGLCSIKFAYTLNYIMSFQTWAKFQLSMQNTWYMNVLWVCDELDSLVWCLLSDHFLGSLDFHTGCICLHIVHYLTPEQLTSSVIHPAV